jgi:tripartite-type tricarboxylate transporter receptor subunit TctC
MSTFDRLVSSRRRALVCTLALAAFAPLGAQADAAYPNRPVRLVVPYSTGGNTDLVVRVLAPSLTKQLGQTFVIDNKPGAGGQRHVGPHRFLPVRAHGGSRRPAHSLQDRQC